MSACYELFQGTDDQYYFRLKAANGEIILQSEGDQAKQGAETGISSVRVNSPLDERYENRTSVNSKYYFVLKASNEKVIGASQMYTTTQGGDKGIASVKANGADAPTHDLTGE